MQACQRPRPPQPRIFWHPFERIWEDSRTRNPGIYWSMRPIVVQESLPPFTSTWSYIFQVILPTQRRAVEQSRHQDIANSTIRHMRICSSSSTLEKKPHESRLRGGAYKTSLHHLKRYIHVIWIRNLLTCRGPRAYTACNLQLQPFSTLLNLMFVLHHSMVQLHILSRDWSIAGLTQGIKLRLYQI